MKIRNIAFFYSGMAAAAALWILITDLECAIFGMKGFVEAWILAFFIFCASLYSSERYPWANKLEKLFAKILTPLPTQSIFLIALLSSVSEELLFRGVIQNELGIVIASLLFGLVHVPIRKEMIPWTLSAVVMGFVLGGLYKYSGYLLAPITLHFLINFLNIWIINQKYKTQ